MLEQMMMRWERPGTHRRPPCQAAVTVGRRGPRGAPVDTDRFFVMEFKPSLEAQVGRIRVPSRRPHPAFVDAHGEPVGLTEVTGILVHSELADALDTGLKAYRPPETPTPPDRRPWCSSRDGSAASRWDGKEWGEVTCPFEACPYYQMEREGCKPHTSMTFLLTVPGRPKLLAWWQTGSVYATNNAFDFVRLVRSQFEGLGLPETWYGIPVRLSISMQKRPGDEGGRRFPVVRLALDGELQESLTRIYRVREQVARLLGFRGADAPRLPAARELADEHPDTNHAELSGAPLVLPAPRAVLDEHPAIVLQGGLEIDPDGFPTCPSCAGAMEPHKGHSGWGWLCHERAGGCKGARLWDGSPVPRRNGEGR